jgi:glycosyltransferase involved in cell wall biosynthesis
VIEDIVDDEDEGKSKPAKLYSKIINFLFPKFQPAPESARLNLESNRGLTGQNIVTLSTQDWGDLWTRKQRFMQQFANQGNKVLYVETQFHYLTYLKQFKIHWRRIYLFLLGPRRINENLFLYTPPLLLPAFQIFPSLARINNFLMGICLKRVMARLGMSEPILWMYSHYNQPLIKKLESKKALYECVDEFSGAKGLIKPETVRKQERATLTSVDAAIVTAPALKNSKEIFNRNIYVVSNAANVAHFASVSASSFSEPDDLHSLPRPRLIFIGGIAYWIDLNLVRYLATSRPDWQILMVGPVMANTEILHGLSNVHFLGRKPYDLLPNYLSHSDIALNPYKIDSVAENCSPLKLYEYMAAGIPIVSTDMPEARQFPELIKIAATPEQYISQISDFLSMDRASRERYCDQARREARNHTWESRFLQADKIAQEMLL